MNKNDAISVFQKLKQEFKNDYTGAIPQKDIAGALMVVLQEAFYYQEEIKLTIKKEKIIFKIKNLFFEYVYDRDGGADSLHVNIGKYNPEYCDEKFSLKSVKIDSLIQKIQDFTEEFKEAIIAADEQEEFKKEIIKKREVLITKVDLVKIDLKEKFKAEINNDGTYRIELNNLSEDSFNLLFNQLNQ